MAVRRIVANVAAQDVAGTARFYREVLGVMTAMDMGWIATLTAPDATMTPQLSIMREGGSGAPVPALSIEVDDFDGVLARCRAGGHEPCYGPVAEPWGVRRFFVADPAGTLVNVLQHDSGDR